MDEDFCIEKVKVLEMQANYLRYLASIYPQMSPVQSSPASSNYSSQSPMRSSRNINLHDDIPIRTFEKPFEQILEEKLQQNSSFDSPNGNSINMNPISTPQTRFLKRGQGHLCSITRSLSSPRLKTLKNRFTNIQINSNSLDAEKVSELKKEIIVKNKIIKKQEREIAVKKRIDSEENRKRQERNRDKRVSPSKDEIDSLKKTVQRLIESDKVKTIKHQEEVKKLNTEISNLKRRVNELERKNNQLLYIKALNPALKNTYIRNQNERPREGQGKIKKYIEKVKLTGTKATKHAQDIIFDPQHSIIFNSEDFL
ncbi:hypothetical protein SteCoe_36019 [Stentor coeruleus]|uniref:Uncharacterized protein n=1 Tax=Stentor coeruleus TaxID=5963 RepID=A0A1R2AR21_9CILI|nr:hypothetical protein SteCoe_36019 [Stentor coeruleus]